MNSLPFCLSRQPAGLDLDSPAPLRVAIYARVSSDAQSRQGTIDSQLQALRQRLSQDHQRLSDDLCFVDDGYSGSTLLRPALPEAARRGGGGKRGSAVRAVTRPPGSPPRSYDAAGGGA